MENQKLKTSFITIKVIYQAMQKWKSHIEILRKSSNQVASKFSIPRKGTWIVLCNIDIQTWIKSLITTKWCMKRFWILSGGKPLNPHDGWEGYFGQREWHKNKFNNPYGFLEWKIMKNLHIFHEYKDEEYVIY